MKKIITITDIKKRRLSKGVKKVSKYMIDHLKENPYKVKFNVRLLKINFGINQITWNIAPISFQLFGKLITTVHDLISIESEKNKLFKIIRYYWIWSILKKSDRIIAVSNYTANKINMTFNNEFKNKISVIEWGYDSNIGLKLKQEYKNNKKKHYLMITNNLLHKNNEIIIKAYNDYNRNNDKPEFIIVGLSNKNIPLSKNIKLYNNLLEEEIYKLYSKCIGLICGSLEEGFGLTVADAYYAGIPTAVSRIPVFKELYPESLFFDPRDINTIIKAFEILGEEIPNKNREIHTWETTLNKYSKVFNEYLCK